MKNQAINYVITLSTNSMPFADDANYDVEAKVILTETFDNEKAAKAFFKSKVKELNLRGRYNSYSNHQYELYMSLMKAA